MRPDSSGITCRKGRERSSLRFRDALGVRGGAAARRLRRGERVLVHCRGGLGRAGSVAARLLVEFGAAPVDAIAQVRVARPGAIETREQEQWVHAQQAVDAARDARWSRQLACLLGGAIGDALGYRVEFDSLAAIRRKHGEEGLRLANAGGVLEVSDDTQMSLFTLEGQLRAAQDEVPLLEAIRHAYLDWYRTQNGRWNARDRSQATGWFGTPCCGSGRRLGIRVCRRSAPAGRVRWRTRSTTAKVAAA